LQYRHSIGDIDASIIIGISCVLTTELGGVPEEQIEQQDRIADVEGGVTIDIPTDEHLWTRRGRDDGRAGSARTAEIARSIRGGGADPDGWIIGIGRQQVEKFRRESGQEGPSSGSVHHSRSLYRERIDQDHFIDAVGQDQISSVDVICDHSTVGHNISIASQHEKLQGCDQ